MIIKIMEGSRDAEVRCLACFMRFWHKRGTRKAKCPGCGIEWRIFWPFSPGIAMSRSSNWENYPTGDKL